MSHRFFKLFQVATISGILFSVGCGKGKPAPYSYEGPGNWDKKYSEVTFPAHKHASIGSALVASEPSVPADQRRQFCAIQVAAETDSGLVDSLLNQLTGRWEKKIRDRGFLESVDYSFFEFSNNAGYAKSSTGGFKLFSGDADIHFKRACLSVPLVREDAYSGFRILELEANNNDGVSYMAFRFERPSGSNNYPTLLLTNHHYSRYGQTEELKNINAVFAAHNSGEASVRIGIFTEKK